MLTYSSVGPMCCCRGAGSRGQAMRLIFSIATVFVFAYVICAQAQPVSPAERSTPAAGTAQPAVQEPMQSKEWRDIFTRLDKIDSTVAKIAEQSRRPDIRGALVAAISGLVGVIVGGIINLLIQR